MNMRALSLFVVVTFFTVATAVAHPVSVTRSLVYVSRSHVNVRIEVFLEDLYLFHNLKQNDADFLDSATIQRGIELHREFVARRFVIQNADGTILSPHESPIVTATVPPGGVSLAELMAHKLIFDMRYTFETPPEFLTFQQQFTDPDGVLLSEMQLQVKQENAGDTVSKALVLNTPETIRFDWNNPPLTENASLLERERWTRQQQEELLGITSYSSVYSFLYIEAGEVRHEILIPLLTLEQSIPMNRMDRNFLSVVEQDAIRPLIEEYFTSGNPIEVDGQRLTPNVDRCDFYGVDFRDFAQMTERKPVAVSSARVGVILSYPLSTSPAKLRLKWDRFSKSLWAVSMVAFTEDGGIRKTLSRIGANDVFEWNAPSDWHPDERLSVTPVDALLPVAPTVRMPVAAIGLLILGFVLTGYAKRTSHRRCRFLSAAGLLPIAAFLWICGIGTFPLPFGSPPAISDEEADKVVSHLLHNAYDAFRFQGENEVYDALAVSTSGDLLQDLYLQIQQSLQVAEQGGAVARVSQVNILEAKTQAASSFGRRIESQHAFACQCRWNVAGTIEHWGHIHERTNQFAAMFLVEPIRVTADNSDSAAHQWKLTSMTITDSQRLHFETRVRSLSPN